MTDTRATSDFARGTRHMQIGIACPIAAGAINIIFVMSPIELGAGEQVVVFAWPFGNGLAMWHLLAFGIDCVARIYEIAVTRLIKCIAVQMA